MASDIIIQVENLSKQYRLGEVSTGSLGHDINRWWHRVRGQSDPYLKVTRTNVREREAQPAGSSAVEPTDYVWALRDINFEIKRGEVLGVIGRNGAGKSTLLKILSRVTAPTSGEIRVDGRIAALLEVGTGFHQDLTGRENIYLNGAVLGMTKGEIAGKLDEIVEFSGCARYLDTPVKRYSSGMIVRLGFAVAAHLEPDILIVDEVLAVGDLEFQKKCLGKMENIAGEGRTVIFVSHNMASIKNLCKSAILIDKGSLVDQGDAGEVVNDYVASSISHSISIQPKDHRVHSPLQVESIDFGENPGISTSVVRSNDPIVIRLRVQNCHAERCQFKGAIELRANGECFCTLISPELHIEAGETRVFRCTIPPGVIRAGLISFTVGLVGLPRHTMADLLCDMASLVIAPADPGEENDHLLERARGVVYLPSKWD